MSNNINSMKSKTLRKQLNKIISSHPYLSKLSATVDSAQKPKLLMLQKVFDAYVKSGLKKSLTRKESKIISNDILGGVVDVKENIIKREKELIRKRKAARVAREAKKNIYYPLVDLGKKIDPIITKFKGAFELTLNSGITMFNKKFQFNHYNHFWNWFQKLLENPVDLVSESWGNVLIEGQNENLFALVYANHIHPIAGGCNKHTSSEKIITSYYYKFNCFNPSSMNNNCFFSCLKYLGCNVDVRKVRTELNLPFNKMIDVSDCSKILEYLKFNVDVVDYEINEELDETKKYIILKNTHYYVVDSFEVLKHKNQKTKRGLMTFDFETRKTEQYNVIEASKTKAYILKDAICCVYYNEYKSKEKKSLKFITNSNKNSARQFLDFLNSEAKNNRYYNVLSHNGSNFDNYFLIGSMTALELKDCEINMRGLSIIGINFRGNLFKDSYCFLTDSLENLCNSFQIEHGKITTITIGKTILTSAQLCFYKPSLTFDGFLTLQNTDIEFWNAYTKYCLYDCIALYEIWEKFTKCVNGLISNISPFYLAKCPLMSSLTIGSHAKKILNTLNKGTYYKQQMVKFIEDDNDEDAKINKKYNFVCNFKRGGISHCNQMGKHTSGIAGFDIKSQYPASLNNNNAFVPCGESRWDTTFNKNVYGFYLVKDLVFHTNYKFKPVAAASLTSLDWASDNIGNLYVDSYMLAYLIDNAGLYSYKIVEGLISDQQMPLSDLFGQYIDTFYSEKERQDKLKETKDILYNPALRQTIKLYLNSLTGKLVENPSTHFSLIFNNDSKKVFNGCGVEKEFNTEKINEWITCGVMVYSYSKRLLFEYINCLPNKSNDVIHVETDGIYFSQRLKKEFIENVSQYKGDYACVSIGDKLGNLDCDKNISEGNDCYFLGKKFYYLDNKAMRIKGIPQKTIKPDGSKIQLVDKQLYMDVYNGLTVSKTFSVLKKNLYETKATITAFDMTRRIKPSGKYSEYL